MSVFKNRKKQCIIIESGYHIGKKSDAEWDRSKPVLKNITQPVRTSYVWSLSAQNSMVLAGMEQCGFQEHLIGRDLSKLKERQERCHIGIIYKFVGAASVKPGSLNTVNVVG